MELPMTARERKTREQLREENRKGYTLLEASELTGIAISTLTSQVRIGRIKGVKNLMRWEIELAELNRYLISVGREAITNDNSIAV